MLTAQGIDQLKTYGQGILARAGHHAMHVRAVVPALIGYSVVYADTVELRGNGTLNVAWLKMPSGRRYAWTYDHPTHKVVVKQGSLSGGMIAAFDDNTPLLTIERVFSNL